MVALDTTRMGEQGGHGGRHTGVRQLRVVGYTMNVRELINDDDAVSPVIGVILMVAITVILAAVIATFVLGLGDQVSDTAPQASFQVDYQEGASSQDSFNASASNYDGLLTVRHAGGATIQAGNLRLAGASSNSSVNWNDGPFNSSEGVQAGDEVDIAVNSTDTVQVTWTNDEGTNSATLREWVGPDA